MILHFKSHQKRANIISIEKQRFDKKKSFGTIVREVYVFNEKIEEWKVPARAV